MKQKEYELKVTQLKEKKRIKENEINEKLNQMGEEISKLRKERFRLRVVAHNMELEKENLKEELEKVNSEYESEMKQLIEELDDDSHTPSDSVDKLCLELSEEIRELAGDATLRSRRIEFLATVNGELFDGTLNLIKIDEKKFLRLKNILRVIN